MSLFAPSVPAHLALQTAGVFLQLPQRLAQSTNDTATSVSRIACQHSNMRQCLPSGRVQRHHINPLGESAQQYASAPVWPAMLQAPGEPILLQLCCALLHSERTISEICVPNSGFRAYRAAYLQHRFPASDYLSVFVACFCACVTVNQCVKLRPAQPERVWMPS